MQLEKKFAEAIAPGQSDKLISQVLHIQDAEEESVPQDLIVPLKMFKESDALGQILVLVGINHSKHSEETQARKIQKEKPRLSIPEKKKIHRCQMPQEKIEHFLEFLFSRDLLQDVAYGVNKRKFDSSEQRKVANAILTMKYSHTIAFYKEICQEINYSPMSDTSLWRVVRGINPSQRKALASLDDFTAAGMNGFRVLLGIAENWKYQDIAKSLHNGKRYLKSKYPAKCSEDSTFSSHSNAFLLSDTKDSDLSQPSQVIHDENCPDFVELISVINQVRDLVLESKDEDLLYDFNVAATYVKAYIKHQIRDVQQKLAKINVFELPGESTAFWLKDYYQKIRPANYQKEYLDKKGMTLHEDIFF